MGRLGCPPIVGDDGGSALIDNNNYATLSTLGDFGSNLGKGLYIGIDIQADTGIRQTIFGTEVLNHTGIKLVHEYMESNERLEFTLRDDNGRELSGQAYLSPGRAKRIVVVIDAGKNTISFYELEPWSPLFLLETVYIKRETPSMFSNLTFPILLGGSNVEGKRDGYFQGRVAHFYIGNNIITTHQVNELRRHSTNPTGLTHELVERGNTKESIHLYLEDLTRLRDMVKAHGLDDSMLRESSVILYRWLLDRNPLLKQICHGCGIQLWLLGRSEKEKKFDAVANKLKPMFSARGSYGSDSIMGYKWIDLNEYITDSAITVNGKEVTNGGLLRLVRNKLGGGHYDEEDRKKWQKELKTISDSIHIAGQNAMNFQIYRLLKGVLEAVDACRIEECLKW